MVFITCCQAPRWTRTKYQPTELAKDEQPKPEGPCPVRTRTTSPWGRTHVTSSGTVLRIYAAPIKMSLRWMRPTGPVTHSVFCRCALCWRLRGMIEPALCHMPGWLRHLWCVSLCLNLFGADCSWSRGDQAVVRSRLCGLFCCVPWPN